MSRGFRLTLKILGVLCLLLLLVAAGASGWLHWRLGRALPRLDGSAALPSLNAPVSVSRDASGVPSIRAASRLDAYRALGWLHAQDRFFQMDLLRRRSAGELSELIGKATLNMDCWARDHRIREAATRALDALPVADRALVAAYTEGVNAGLKALSAPPWEYAVLRSEPRPWQQVDTLLAGYCMLLDLQDAGEFELNLSCLHSSLGADFADFLAPLRAADDAALAGTASCAPIPGPARLNLRLPPPAAAMPAAADLAYPKLNDISALASLPSPWFRPGAGSNAFAVSGSHTRNGAALLANDMHLGLGVPNTWYRVLLSWPASSNGPARQLSGITLPGVPLLVAGSNGRVAWGFTNAYVDTADLILLKRGNAKKTYLGSAGETAYIEHKDQILIKGDKPFDYTSHWTEWGPVVEVGKDRQLFALQWIAHDSRAVDLRFSHIEDCNSVEEAVALAQDSGLPALNLLAADHAGHIAWTVAGRIPRRTGFDGRLATSRHDSPARWEGLLPPEDHPSCINPPSGHLFSANERLMDGEALSKVGDGGFYSAARGRQIQGDLARLTSPAGRLAAPGDLLAIQLDDRALDLAPWRDLLLHSLNEAALQSAPGRASLRSVVESWIPSASTGSAGYRMVREFRDEVEARILNPLLASCFTARRNFSWRQFRRAPAVWALLRERPLHLLAPEYKSWDELLLASADTVLKRNPSPADATWGKANRAAIRHPFSLVMPRLLTFWLDMPDDELAGDSGMPRVCNSDFGASERLVVSPGHESEGIFHMPTGQSANPRSPFFKAGHADWVQGRPSPYLPTAPQHHLELLPQPKP